MIFIVLMLEVPPAVVMYDAMLGARGRAGGAIALERGRKRGRAGGLGREEAACASRAWLMTEFRGAEDEESRGKGGNCVGSEDGAVCRL